LEEKESDESNPTAIVLIKATSAKQYNCPLPGCDKSFKNNNGLKYHLENFKHDLEPLLLLKFKDSAGKLAKEVQVVLDNTLERDFPLTLNGFAYQFDKGAVKSTLLQWVRFPKLEGLSAEKQAAILAKAVTKKAKAKLPDLGIHPSPTQKETRSRVWQGGHREFNQNGYTLLKKEEFPPYLPKSHILSIQFVGDRTLPKSDDKNEGRVSLPIFEAATPTGQPDVGKDARKRWILQTGGAVWGLDFAPLSSTSLSQLSSILAVGGLKDTLNEHHVVGRRMEPYFERDPRMASSIQIWSVPSLDSITSTSSKSGPTKPHVSLLLCHDFGVVYDLKWNPFDLIGEDDQERLGYLAATFGDGSCRVFDVPNPDLKKKKFKSKAVDNGFPGLEETLVRKFFLNCMKGF
jgi:hypothetical protein